jgi:Flp pilus assembly protein TadG
MKSEEGYSTVWLMIILSMFVILFVHHLEIARMIYAREKMITAADAGSLAGAMTGEPLAEDITYETDASGDVHENVGNWKVVINKSAADQQAVQVARLNNVDFDNSQWDSYVHDNQYSFTLKNKQFKSSVLQRIWKTNIFLRASSEAKANPKF